MENEPPATSEPPEPETDAASDSLEAAPDSLEPTGQAGSDETLASPSSDPDADSPKEPPKRWRRLFNRTNLYLLLFVLIILIAVIIILVAYMESRQTSQVATLASKNLSAASLAQLADTDSTIGNSGQTLNIASSAIFAGRVLVRQDLDVAGNLQIGGNFTLNGLTVFGTSQLDETQINKDLSVAGNTNLQGSVTIAKNLQVSGSATFSGPLSAPQVTTSSLQLNGELVLDQHIGAGGATPSRTDGSALGSGGTSSVSGSDTAGSITINTGSSPAAGCFITLNFTAKYNATPHVLVTPVGASAGGLSYYVNRTATSFSVCDATSPPANSSFGFDYFVVD